MLYFGVVLIFGYQEISLHLFSGKYTSYSRRFVGFHIFASDMRCVYSSSEFFCPFLCFAFCVIYIYFFDT